LGICVVGQPSASAKKKGKTTPPQMGENKRKIDIAFNYFSASRDFSLDEVLKGGTI